MKNIKLSDIRLIEIPIVKDSRGNLGVIEGSTIPFETRRVYYLYDVPTSAYRGAHAHKEQQELLIALSGSFDVVLDDGEQKKRFLLNRPDSGLLIPPGIWRELEHFSSGAVCLVLNSGLFEESDYIRDYESFQLSKRS